MATSPCVGNTIRWLVAAAIVGLAIAPIVRWHMLIATAEREEAVRIAAREYLVEFKQPAPPYRELAFDAMPHVLVKWDRTRGAYVVGFGKQAVVDDNPRDYRGHPIPYVSGHTTVEYFTVKRDGSCKHLGSISSGPY